ncbi:MAG: hypothetical protein H5U02_00555 [Clostridia bacterium]|nr:hypothetical protein [Clostridia bacterium]
MDYVKYNYGVNEIINPSAERDLAGWIAIGDITAVPGGVETGGKCFRIGPNASLEQTVNLPQEVDHMLVSGYIHAGGLPAGDISKIMMELEIHYSGGMRDLIIIPFSSALCSTKPGNINGSPVMFSELVGSYSFRDTPLEHIVVRLRTKDIAGYAYFDAISLRTNLPVKTEGAIESEIVHYRTASISAQVVEILFPTPYAVKPTLLINIYGSVTNYTPEFIVEWDASREAYMYTRVRITFPVEDVGKDFTMLVIGR